MPCLTLQPQCRQAVALLVDVKSLAEAKEVQLAQVDSAKLPRHRRPQCVPGTDPALLSQTVLRILNTKQTFSQIAEARKLAQCSKKQLGAADLWQLLCQAVPTPDFRCCQHRTQQCRKASATTMKSLCRRTSSLQTEQPLQLLQRTGWASKQFRLRMSCWQTCSALIMAAIMLTACCKRGSVFLA